MNKVIEKLKIEFNKLENTNMVLELDEIEKRYNDKKFKIAIVGEFSSGKSTLINAIIGKDILSHATVETTATITNIHNNECVNGKMIKATFTTGESFECDDISEVRTLTTTHSEKDVVNEVEKVDIYTKFLDVEDEILLIDTPGLNGVADNHRQKTIDEVKNAHVCVFVFQKNGVTESDREFIRFLMRYNNRFIFVQNFIDELRASEGETPETKITTLDDEIKKIVNEVELDIVYKIVGVSALKALVSKDKSIDKLYEGDLFALSDEQREKFYDESRFANLETAIKDLIEAEKNEKIKEKQAAYSLQLLMKSFLEREDAFNNRNIEEMKEDSAYKSIEGIKERKQTIEKKENKIVKALNNLIENEFVRFEKLLLNDTNKKIQDIFDEMDELISKEKKYDAFVERHKNKHYSNELKLRVDACMKNVEFNEKVVIEEIYASSLKRLGEYTQKKKAKDFDELKLGKVETEKLNNDIAKKKKEIDKISSELIDNKVILNQSANSLEASNRQLVLFERRQKEMDREVGSIDTRYESAVRRLGSRPNIVTRYRTEVEYVERTGFFGRLKGLFVGDKRVERRVAYDDDSARREWDNKKQALERSGYEEKRLLQKEIERVNKEINKYKQVIGEGSQNAERAQSKVAYLSKQVENKTKELEEYETNAKAEYLMILKKDLIEDVNNYLLNDTKKSVATILKTKIIGDFKENKTRMKKEFNNECKKYIAEEIKRLDAIINGNESELFEKYYSERAKIDVIRTIYSDWVEEIYESV